MRGVKFIVIVEYDGMSKQTSVISAVKGWLNSVIPFTLHLKAK